MKRGRFVVLLFVLATAISWGGRADAAPDPACTAGPDQSATGSLVAWGRNIGTFGGPGTTGTCETDPWIYQPTSVALPTGTTITQVSSGSDAAYAVDQTGRLWAWGDNTYAELGDGTLTARAQPAILDVGGPVAQVAAGPYGAYALTTAGQVYAWGADSSGRGGVGCDGTLTSRCADDQWVGRNGIATESQCGADPSLACSPYLLTPTLVPLPGPAVSIASSAENGYAVLADGRVWSWGAAGPWLGAGAAGSVNQPSPISVALPAGVAVVTVAPEVSNVLALTDTGAVLAWGDNRYGGLGVGSLSPSATPLPVAIPGNETVVSLAAQGSDGLAITASGRVLGWGAVSRQAGSGGIPLGVPDCPDPDTSLGVVVCPSPAALSLPTGLTYTGLGTAANAGFAMTSTGQAVGWSYNGVNNAEDGAGTNSPDSQTPFVSVPAGFAVTAVGTSSSASTVFAIVEPSAPGAALADSAHVALLAVAAGLVGAVGLARARRAG